MTTALTFRTDKQPDGRSVLAVAGEIDMSNARTFGSALASALPADGRLVVDLSAVQYLDTAGLAVLFPHARQIEIVVPSLLAPVVAISGLADITTVRPAGS
jgi:anti-sigma B factor antagonist